MIKLSEIKESSNLGIALGGGAVLGAAHIGVLKALKENGIKANYITGTSIGAFVSIFYAFGFDWEEIESIVNNLNWFEISAMTLSKFGLLSNEKMGNLISKYIGEKNLEDSDIPIAIVTTDITTGEKVILNKGNIAKAVMASTCLPGIFVPVEINGKLLVDGGIVENVPLEPLKQLGADLAIGVDLNSEYKHKRPENIIEVMLNAFDFTLLATTRMQTEKADLLIKPDLTGFNMVDTKQLAELTKKGYIDASKILKNLA